LSHLGSDSPQLADFGLRARKPKRQPTAIELTISVANWRATRKARGTMGPKQRKAITTTGSPGVIVVDPNGKPLGGRPPVPPRGR
jgi:hypothetical protein